ncbi:TraR/DksA family transcriptional regulator [Rivibacter subsaxonicus]|uniref:TraR/DksA family transcriptional regulator n=1 Tax=Rivibacter subsaxonicus TaxID=457575 RepID=A0A4Q7W0F9_9BURK|nr:TraR/DksA C4-type zinc finger protein [Rivibacter subsaxonicus]RZU02580.1 TraR/DksA family transcriptional regulator [Rivibacter subsaxonicus]
MAEEFVGADATPVLRQLLERQAAALRQRLRHLDESGLARVDEEPREVLDRKDEAALDLAHAVDGAEAHRDAVALCAIEAALRRVERGDYGRCADCGEAIALARLQIEPAAERCTPCQQAREARR